MSLPRLRAPQGDGEILAHPPLTAAADLVALNRAIFAESRIEIDGVPLSELRRRAAAEAARAAQRFLGLTVSDAPPPALFLVGHQPELFHPGVWVKNFALYGLARRHGAVPLGLLVDNDTAKATTVRVPVWDADPEKVHLASVPLDHFSAEVPYEERTVADEAFFASFPDRLTEVTHNWPYRPLAPEVWDEVKRQVHAPLGERLAAGRRMLERRWGCENLEVPLSHLCAGTSFLHFVRGILSDLPAFAATYNECVRAYRKRHDVRSRNHPVPDLARDGDWHEAPFWALRAGGHRRARLFARRQGDRVQLRAGSEEWGDWPVGGPVTAWRELEFTGRKVRTRALTTTLFARLLLADVFIHGIGGGKYDELTDEIVRLYFRLPPPGFLVLTVTLRLPLPRFPATPDDLRLAQRFVRDRYWNPQRYLSAQSTNDPAVRSIVAERSALASSGPVGQPARRDRYTQFRELAKRLRPLVGEDLRGAVKRRDRVEQEVAANEVLGRRDFAFCLFPEEKIRPFCAQFLAGDWAGRSFV
jgi:hypothetical protein